MFALSIGIVGKNFFSESSTDNLFCSASFIIAAAVNALVILPIEARVPL